MKIDYCAIFDFKPRVVRGQRDERRDGGNWATNVARSLFSVAAVLALTGCEAVFTERPLGDEVVTLDPAIWQGTWLSGEIVLLTTVLDGEAGQLQAAWMERGNAGTKFETVVGSVRRSGQIMYLSMVHEPTAEADATGESVEATQADHPNLPEYFWARIENDGRRAILWWPQVEQIRLAVGDGRLPGIVKDDNDVVLGRLEDAQLELINAPASGLLQWSRPVTFIRIGD